MGQSLLGVVIGLCLFILPLWSYRKGLKDGISIQKDKPIEPIKTPVQSIQHHLDERKQLKEIQKTNHTLAEGIKNIMSYDGTPQEVNHEKRSD